MATCTVGVIALCPTGNTQGGYCFFSLNTGWQINLTALDLSCYMSHCQDSDAGASDNEIGGYEASEDNTSLLSIPSMLESTIRHDVDHFDPPPATTTMNIPEQHLEGDVSTFIAGVNMLQAPVPASHAEQNVEKEQHQQEQEEEDKP
eukprot:13417101-Ditylum_brightwellii.AAC.1